MELWCAFVLKPLSLSLVCVFVSQKKRKKEKKEGTHLLSTSDWVIYLYIYISLSLSLSLSRTHLLVSPNIMTRHVYRAINDPNYGGMIHSSVMMNIYNLCVGSLVLSKG